MTNFEYYKKEILEITNKGYDVAVINNKPVSCESLEYCTECQLKNHRGCYLNLTKWFCAEHIEQPKLTKKERHFCELVETGWIARDVDESLYYFEEEPARDKKRKVWDEVPFSKVIEIDQFDDCDFDFITCEDREPWSIEDLLKLEVEE